jgi:ribosome-binding protein aMBF1 (putative translation factor)
MRETKRTANRQKSNGRKSVTGARSVGALGSSEHTWHKVVAFNLRRARKRSQLSVEELARKAKLAPDLVESVERAEPGRLRADDIQKLADALQTDVTDLTKGCGPEGA